MNDLNAYGVDTSARNEDLSLLLRWVIVLLLVLGASIAVGRSTGSARWIDAFDRGASAL